VVDVVVEERRAEVVRRADRVVVARQMEVEILHRDHLRVSSSRSPALDTEHRSERGLSYAHRRALAYVAQTLPEPDRRRGLALAERRRRNGGHVNVLPVGARAQPFQRLKRDLRLVATVLLDLVLLEPQLLGQVEDGSHTRLLGDLQV